MHVQVKFALLAAMLPWLQMTVHGRYHPDLWDKFRVQLRVGASDPFDYNSEWADMYDTDLWAVTSHDISVIHAKGSRVICYFSAGTHDPNRPDAHHFHSSDIGNQLKYWPEEHYIDIRSSNVRSIMAARMDLAKSKHCDGIDPDNVDSYQVDNNSGFSFGYADQVDYNKWLAQEAHNRGLAIGLKNDVAQLSDLYQSFDFAINEGCHKYNECGDYSLFLNQRKPVFNLEYVDGMSVTSHDLQKCHHNTPSGMQVQFKIRALTSWTHYCTY